MDASSRDLSALDVLVLFLPAVPGLLFLYIAEMVSRFCAVSGLDLGLSGYALLDAVGTVCGLSPLVGFPLYCWYFFRRSLGNDPLYPALLYLAQSFSLMLVAAGAVRQVLFPGVRGGDDLTGFLLPLLIALGLLVPLMIGVSAGICRVVRRRMDP